MLRKLKVRERERNTPRGGRNTYKTSFKMLTRQKTKLRWGQVKGSYVFIPVLSAKIFPFSLERQGGNKERQREKEREKEREKQRERKIERERKRERERQRRNIPKESERQRKRD